MSAAVIGHKLDLLVRLIDTTTGRKVEERSVRFRKDGRPCLPVPKGSGSFAFLDCGREDGILEITVPGYDSCQVSVEYGKLDSLLPVMEAFLMPSKDEAASRQILVFSGRLPGLSSIQAISLGAACCCISGFDERTCIMKLFNPHKSAMDHGCYGVLHPDRQTYEPFWVEEELPESQVKIREPLQEPFLANAPIARIILGRAAGEGEYCLKVRDNGGRLLHLVRYVVNGRIKYKIVDFSWLGEVCLE